MTRTAQICALVLTACLGLPSAAQAVAVGITLQGNVQAVDLYDEYLSLPETPGMPTKFVLEFDTDDLAANLTHGPDSLVYSARTRGTIPFSRLDAIKPTLGLTDDLSNDFADFSSDDPFNPEWVDTVLRIENAADPTRRTLFISITGFDSNPFVTRALTFSVTGPAASLPLSLTDAYSLNLATNDGLASDSFEADYSPGYQIRYALNHIDFSILDDNVTPVPLPASVPLLAGGLASLALAAWRRRNGRAA